MFNSDDDAFVNPPWCGRKRRKIEALKVKGAWASGPSIASTMKKL